MFRVEGDPLEVARKLEPRFRKRLSVLLRTGKNMKRRMVRGISLLSTRNRSWFRRGKSKHERWKISFVHQRERVVRSFRANNALVWVSRVRPAELSFGALRKGFCRVCASAAPNPKWLMTFHFAKEPFIHSGRLLKSVAMAYEREPNFTGSRVGWAAGGCWARNLLVFLRLFFPKPCTWFWYQLAFFWVGNSRRPSAVLAGFVVGAALGFPGHI